jgi:hypothetical protein
MKRTTLTHSAIALTALSIACAPYIALAEQKVNQVLPVKMMTGSTTREVREVEKPRPMASSTLLRQKMEKMENKVRTEHMTSGTSSRQKMENEVRTERTQAHEQKVNAVLSKAKDRADQEIDRRIAALQTFADRVGNVKISDVDKTNLQETMKEQIDALTTLKTQIASDMSTTSLKEAVQSITKSYRVFALVIPKGAITAGADRVNNIVSQLQLLSTKLATRISDAQSTGGNVAKLTTTLTDMNMKISDATSQAQSAVTQISALQPDNGDQTTLKANQMALQDAHKKIQMAQKDLQDARKDAESIVKGLRALGSPKPTATTTSATSAQ